MEGGRNFTTAFYLFKFGAARSIEEPITRYNWNKVDGDVVRWILLANNVLLVLATIDTLRPIVDWTHIL